MAKNTTKVYLREIQKNYNNTTSRVYRTIGNNEDCDLYVEGFENGIITVNPAAGCSIYTFAEALAGCFSEDSNFCTEVLEAYNCDENTTFTGIKFEFSGVTLIVTKENANKNRIFSDWKAGLEANAEKNRRNEEAWQKTAEGQKQLAQQRKKEAEVLRIDETVEMEFKDEEGKKAWDNIVEVNSSDPYGNKIIKYARRWAKYMQKLIAEGKKVVEIAEKTSYDCDLEGMSRYAYSCAVNALIQSWKYGEELRKWHNKDYGHKGDDIVNPAVLTSKVD